MSRSPNGYRRRYVQRVVAGDVERIEHPDGSTATWDHQNKTVKARINLGAAPGPCPHRLGLPEGGTSPCMGQAGHITPDRARTVHMDREGRQWT